MFLQYKSLEEEEDEEAVKSLQFKIPEIKMAMQDEFI